MIVKNYDTSNISITLIFMLIFIGFLLTSMFSPLGGYFIGLMFLAFGAGKNLPLRIILTLFTIFNLAYVGASKYYTSTFGDDFGYIYLPVYNYISSGGSIFYHEFSGGLEFLLPLYFKVCTVIFGVMTPVEVLVSVSLLNLILFYIWMERFGLQFFPEKFKSIAIAIAIIFFSYTIYLHIMRQSLASVLLLFSLSLWLEKKYIYCFLFLLMSCVSHISSIIFFPLFLFLFLGKDKYKNIFIIFLFFIVTIFPLIIDVIINYSLLGSATYKAEFYKSALELGDTNNFLDVILSAKNIIVAFLILTFCAHNKFLEVKSFLFYSILFVVAVYSLSQLPYRFMNMLYLISGYFIFISVLRYINWFKILFILFIFFKMYSMIEMESYINHIRQNPHDINYNGLWYSYPWADDKPFYYLDK